MVELHTWEDLANQFGGKNSAREPLRADWFAYVKSEEHGTWLITPDKDSRRADLSLLAARAIEKLGIGVTPNPTPAQHDPLWPTCLENIRTAPRRKGKKGIDASDLVPPGFGTVDRDPVDPCTRSWLEVLRRSNRGFERGVSTRGRIGVRPINRKTGKRPAQKTHETVSGVFKDVFAVSATQCIRLAAQEIQEGIEATSKGTGGKPAPRRTANAKSDFPGRAKWLRDRLQERSWSKHDVSRQGGPDHKTVQKILNGQRIRDDVLARLASALSMVPPSKKLPLVIPLDIPQS